MLREAAEYPNAYVELRPGQERIETARYTLCLEPRLSGATVQRQRFAAGEVDEVLAEVRATLRARGRTRTQWEVGGAARPEGLVEMLLARGLRLDEDPRAVAVALTVAPPPGPADASARAVASVDEYVAATEVQAVAFGAPVDERRRAELRAEWDLGPRRMHAVWLDGEMVAAGTCAPVRGTALALFGGATLPHARGRGAYRALVAARWEEAQRLGLGALVTQAGSMSAPILTRLGFVPVGHVDMLVDEFGATA